MKTHFLILTLSTFIVGSRFHLELNDGIQILPSIRQKDICKTNYDPGDKEMVKPCKLPFKYNNKTMNMCIRLETIRISGAICPVDKPNETWFEEDLWGFCLLKPEGNCDETDGKEKPTTAATIFTTKSETKKPNITCPPEESYLDGSCRCGKAESCANNNDGMKICHRINKQCVCSKDGTSCNEKEHCIREECSVHGEWTAWKDDGKCNVPCGKGLKRQKRVCDVKGNGDTCKGRDNRNISCEISCPVQNIKPCTECAKTKPDKCECGWCGSNDPCEHSCYLADKNAEENGLEKCQCVNCELGEWMNWSGCISECTKESNKGICSRCTKTRLRQLKYPLCNSNKTCPEDTEEEKDCLNDEPCDRCFASLEGNNTKIPCKFPFKYKQDPRITNCIKHTLPGQGEPSDICPISNPTGDWLENQEYGICNFFGCEVPKGTTSESVETTTPAASITTPFPGRICVPSVGLASNRNFTKTLLSYTDEFRICVMARGNTDANGFAWDRRSKKCFAIDKANRIDKKETFWTSCIFTNPCPIGFKYQRGNVKNIPKEVFDKKIDNEQCAVKCRNTSWCMSYQYYDGNCALFDNDTVKTDGSSGYFNCKFLGKRITTTTATTTPTTPTTATTTTIQMNTSSEREITISPNLSKVDSTLKMSSQGSKNHEIRARKDDVMRTLVFSGAVQQNAIATTGMKMSQDEVPNAKSTVDNDRSNDSEDHEVDDIEGLWFNKYLKYLQKEQQIQERREAIQEKLLNIILQDRKKLFKSQK